MNLKQLVLGIIFMMLVESVNASSQFGLETPIEYAGQGFFEVSLSTGRTTIKQDQEKQVQLTVKNLLDREQKIFISVESELETIRPFGEIVF